MELDKDLQARQEARELALRAQKAQAILGKFPQSKLDEIVKAVADAFYNASRELAEMAAQETGFGNVSDKITKNQFASNTVYENIKDMKTVGV